MPFPHPPPGPLRQVPMDQLPATAPKVIYENGLLSIAAQNSTLGEILRDVKTLTGASIDLPPNGASERVVTQLGPGTPREVLARLLDGTAYNYIMVGSTADPRAIASVMLTAKPAGGEMQTAAVYQPPPVQPQPMQTSPFPGMNMPRPAVVQPAEEDNSDDEDKDDEDSDQAEQPGQGAAVTQPDPNANQQQPTPPAQFPNAGPRTPEQIMEMLRHQQQTGQQGPQE